MIRNIYTLKKCKTSATIFQEDTGEKPFNISRNSTELFLRDEKLCWLEYNIAATFLLNPSQICAYDTDALLGISHFFIMSLIINKLVKANSFASIVSFVIKYFCLLTSIFQMTKPVFQENLFFIKPFRGKLSLVRILYLWKNKKNCN